MPSVPTQEASWANGTRSAPSSSPLLAAAFLLAGQLPAFAPQAGGDAVFHPLAIRCDAISFLFWADYYPAGTDELSDHEAPDWVQSVQAATPAPPVDAKGRRITPSADTLVLNSTVTVPDAPQLIDVATLNPPPLFPGTRLRSPCPGPTRNRWASNMSITTGIRTRCGGIGSSRRNRSRWC
jgi:hypothetical protein